MDVESQFAGNPAVDSAGRIKHEGSRPGDDAAPGVVINSLHDVDFFAQLRSLTDDLPRLAGWRRITGNHGKAVTVFPEHSPPPAVFTAVCPFNVVVGGLPVALGGTYFEAFPDDVVYAPLLCQMNLATLLPLLPCLDIERDVTVMPEASR
jgi:hypothetical protein